MKEEIKNLVFTEIKKGTSPDKIRAMVIATGIPADTVDRELFALEKDLMRPIIDDTLGALNPFGKSKKTADEGKITLSKEKFWDPAGEEISAEKLDGDITKLELKYLEYKGDPGAIKRNLFFCTLPAMITIGLVIMFPQIISSLANAGDDGQGLGLLFLPFIPLIWYIAHVFKVQIDVAKMMIAKKEGWLYSPAEKYSRWSGFCAKFPELFNKGHENQNLQDEFWGTFEADRQKVHFWSGIFEYTIVTSGSKGRKSRRKVINTGIAMKLNKHLKTDFRLEPEGFLSKFLNIFRSKEINTESHDFNQAFAFFYNGKKSDEELQIVRVVSPSVQVRLLEMKEAEGPFCLQFRDDIVVFLFNRNLFKKMHTNFFRKVEIDQRDIEAIESRLKKLLHIAGDIVPFLD